jgi:tetratricopeptide (TPR) repeat protein
MYFDYLKTGDAQALRRVLYHNVQDILSMVALLACLGRSLADPLAEPSLDPADLVSLARWHEDLGQSDRAETIFRRALEHILPSDVQAVAWQRLGLLLKQQGRYEEARLAWEQLAVVGHDITAHVELAKHYEWRVRRQDIGAALHWTQAALEQVETWQPGYARDQARAELMHRQRRLQRKHAPPAAGGKTGRLPSERRQKRK